MSRYQPIQTATLGWQDETPFSEQHGDIYFSKTGGLEETDYVFIQGNDLPGRWHERTSFTIAETGFGTGLNFLATLAAWQTSAPAGAHLHYISVEKYPFTAADLKQSLAHWPQLNSHIEELLAVYPQPVHGFHQRQLCQGRVTLTLLLGDANDLLPELEASVDAWYLDGFAPGKNPDMWQPALFEQIARLTNDGGTFATFTAAGDVRRSLEAAGFSIKKRPGFGRKREMLTGSRQGTQQPASPAPWFTTPAVQQSTAHNAVVIGAGLAGISTAHALAGQGWQVTVLEKHSAAAQAASGNLAGVVMPRLTADMAADGRFYLSAFLHASKMLDQLKQHHPDLQWQRSGVLQLMTDEQLSRLGPLHLP